MRYFFCWKINLSYSKGWSVNKIQSSKRHRAMSEWPTQWAFPGSCSATGSVFQSGEKGCSFFFFILFDLLPTFFSDFLSIRITAAWRKEQRPIHFVQVLHHFNRKEAETITPKMTIKVCKNFSVYTKLNLNVLIWKSWLQRDHVVPKIRIDLKKLVWLLYIHNWLTLRFSLIQDGCYSQQTWKNIEMSIAESFLHIVSLNLMC